MPANAKWPDFRLASTLRFLAGSQSRAQLPPPEKQADHRDAPVQQIYAPDDAADSYDTRLEAHDPAAVMTDSQERSVDGIEGFEGFDDEVVGADADFGALEMFDSNASQAPYSSHVGSSALPHAPEALMSDQLPSSAHSKKSKRDKKNKKKKRSSMQNEPSHLSSFDNSSTMRTGPLEEDETEPVTAAPANGDDEFVVPSTQSKKKRKLSNSADGKRRKKRRSQEQDDQDVVESTQQDDSAGAFLRKGKGKGIAPESVIYEEETEEPAVRNSPSAERLRRRSHSREALSRENSVALAADADLMDVDEANGLNNTGETALVLDAPAEVERDVESLAREAWNEHLNAEANPMTGINDQDASADDVDEPGLSRPSVYDLPVNPSQTESTPRRARSTRAKKAKPTFYEQPPEQDDDVEDNLDALDELPSPSAMTPKARRRTQKATKGSKRARAPKLSQSMRGGSEDPDGDASGGRRNKMAGYTQGRFTDEELARIKRAVETFRDQNDLPQKEVNEMIQAPGGTTAGDDHAQLWLRIFAECPDRHRQKVINIARKKFHNFVARGTWTVEQDAELAELIGVHGTKWSQIAGLINRHPEDVRDRYRNYIVCGDSQRKDAWDETEEARLTQYVIEAMEAIDELRQNQPSRELLKKPYEELIDWQNISERMDRTRSRLQCITKWKWLHIRTHGKDKLASSQPNSQISFGLEKARRQVADMPEEEQFRLLMAIQGTAVGADNKIPWQRLVDKQFRNKWHRSTQVLLWHRLKMTVPDFQKKTTRDCSQHLINVYKQTAELPGVADGVFDDAAEMSVIQSIPVFSGAQGTPGGKTVSDEYIVNSDPEEGGADVENGAAPDAIMDTDDIQIDPALTEAPRPAKKTPAKKTASKRAASSKKKNKATPAPTQDPIEDGEDVGLGYDGAQDDGSEIDVEQFRKKKTPSKFQASGGRRPKREAGVEQPLDASDSDMDDMEDLPARIAT